ncbi:MAG: hypothetical protein CENE_01729 [Candidatus Celerinatantimonas neptuna]|nr:MAG: hypothetical protein CENE_01729 [Candidatus Celerinatantimonas neptuna]
MLIYIFIALFNGVCISLCRVINGRLSKDRNSFVASYANHIGGFIFLTVILLIWKRQELVSWNIHAPWFAYLGGAMGAIYVAINSFIVPRIGSTQAAIFVMGGQMLSGVVIDQFNHPNQPWRVHLLAVCLILCGIGLSKIAERRRIKKSSPIIDTPKVNRL